MKILFIKREERRAWNGQRDILMVDSKAGSGQRAGTWVFHFPDSVFALFPSVVPSTECLRIREELGRTSKIFDLINKNDRVDGEVRKNRFLWEERN